MRRHWLPGCLLSLAVLAPAAEIKNAPDAQWIEDAGGAVIRDAAGRITGVDLRASWVTDPDLRKLAQFPDLDGISICRSRGSPIRECRS